MINKYREYNINEGIRKHKKCVIVKFEWENTAIC